MNEHVIRNKIITTNEINMILDIVEKTKNRFNNLFREDEQINQNKPYSEQKHRYHSTDIPKTLYTITYTDGTSKLETSDLYIVKDELSKPERIDNITILYSVYYSSNMEGSYVSHHFAVSFYTLLGDEARVTVTSDNCDSESYQVVNEILDVFNRSKTRYDKVVKNRFLYKCLYSLFIGSFISHVCMLVFYIMHLTDKEEILKLMFKNLFTYGIVYWFLSAALGLFFGFPRIKKLYTNIEPRKGNFLSNSDMINDFSLKNELCFGEKYDNPSKRLKIESYIEKARKVLLIQLGVVLIIGFILTII